MSVTGEFHRLAEACVAYLDASSAPDAERWSADLQQAAARGSDSLSAAAGEALDLLETAGTAAPRFAEAHEREEFRELVAHLAAICRAIVGRPVIDEGDTH